MNKRLLLVGFLFALIGAAGASAQPAPNSYAHGLPIGTARLSFPGRNGGYTFVHIPMRDVTEWGDTVVADRAFLLDLNLSHDGLFLSPDTVLNITGNTNFEFVFSHGHIIHASLAPSHTHDEFRDVDSTFNGTLGYGLIQKYTTVFDFKKKTLTFYPLLTSIEADEKDTNLLQLPLIDDARLTYCHCTFPTVWIEASSPPFTTGHVNLAFNKPLSEIFDPALDKATRAKLDKQFAKDTTAGIRRPIGVSISEFKVRTVAGDTVNLARRAPHRAVVDLPKEYHDLNVPILGALGTDVLRTFSGLIIDPSRQKLIFVR